MKPTKHFLAYRITMSVELAALILTILMQTPDTVRLAELNRQADAHLAAYKLDKADPFLDEAVEIAKTFSTDESGKFVNGILDRIKNERKQNGTDKKS